MFEQAARLQLRFATTKGQLTVEDLWKLPLTQLDRLYSSLAEKLETKSMSLLASVPKKDPIVELQVQIIAHIVSVRLDENEAKNNAKAIKEQKQRLLGLIANKELEAEGELSIEQLKAKVKEL